MDLGDFEPFCERVQGRMYNTAYKILQDSQLAEDAVQETLYRIFRLFERLEFQTEKAELVYALRATKHVAITLAKKTKPFEELEKLDATHKNRSDMPFEEAVAHETEQTIEDIIKKLSPKAKAIFVYRRLGIEDAEIASTLGITVSDVRTTSFRTKQKIKQMLWEGECDNGRA